MNRLIACMIGGAVHQTFEGKATTAHVVSTDLSQIYDAASWVGTVELAIVAALAWIDLRYTETYIIEQYRKEMTYAQANY